MNNCSKLEYAARLMVLEHLSAFMLGRRYLMAGAIEEGAAKSSAMDKAIMNHTTIPSVNAAKSDYSSAQLVGSVEKIQKNALALLKAIKSRA